MTTPPKKAIKRALNEEGADAVRRLLLEHLAATRRRLAALNRQLLDAEALVGAIFETRAPVEAPPAHAADVIPLPAAAAPPSSTPRRRGRRTPAT